MSTESFNMATAPRGTSCLPATQRRAFTVIEVLFALMLATVVVSGALAVFSMLGRSDQRLAAEFEGSVDRAVTQNIVRQAMSSLFAAQEEDPALATAEGSQQDGSTADEAEAQAAEEAGERSAEESELASDDAAESDEFTDATPSGRPTESGPEPPHFNLHFAPGIDRVLPALELVLLEPPVRAIRPAEPLTIEDNIASFLPTRGVFEALQLPDEIVLQWRPIEPPGEPVVLIRGLAAVEWWVLPRSRHGRQWVDVYAADIQEYYPVAVRLLMWGRSGWHTDWLFDTSVTQPATR